MQCDHRKRPSAKPVVEEEDIGKGMYVEGDFEPFEAAETTPTAAERVTPNFVLSPDASRVSVNSSPARASNSSPQRNPSDNAGSRAGISRQSRQDKYRGKRFTSVSIGKRVPDANLTSSANDAEPARN